MQIRWWVGHFDFLLCGTFQRPKVPLFVFVPLLAQEPSNLGPKEAELPLRLTFVKIRESLGPLEGQFLVNSEFFRV